MLDMNCHGSNFFVTIEWKNQHHSEWIQSVRFDISMHKHKNDKWILKEQQDVDGELSKT